LVENRDARDVICDCEAAESDKHQERYRFIASSLHR
jgi:hypothetical protein